MRILRLLFFQGELLPVILDLTPVSNDPFSFDVVVHHVDLAAVQLDLTSITNFVGRNGVVLLSVTGESTYGTPGRVVTNCSPQILVSKLWTPAANR